MTTTAGRPRSFDTDVVLDRAVELFWGRGYRDTTTRDLEKQLGISQSSLYNAFGSKQGLMSAALDRYERLTEEALLAPLETSPDGLDAIDVFFDALAKWVTGKGRGGCMIINLMADDGGTDAAVTARTRSYRRRVRDALRDALVRGAGRKDADIRADLLLGEVLGINVAARGAASPQEVHRLVAGAHHLIDGWRPTAG
ncbi:MAG: TetR/AcrR family transcriptional regulator [Acidimicrobiia bacterium]|nr:TetR/AcrR family transcriptional regulator [Acidimicrobiia bacterium]